MAPPNRRAIRLPFPMAGIFEGSGYEDQADLTTVDCQNVRVIPADSTENTAKPSTRSGRARGGQRPGLTKYLADEDVFPISGPPVFQDINSIIWSEITPTNGDGDSVTATNSGGSFLLIDKDGNLTATMGVAGETYNCAVWGRDGFCYVATIGDRGSGSPRYYVVMRKINRKGTIKWDWTTGGTLPVVDVTATDMVVRGMDVHGQIIYLWLKSISGVGSEALYRINTTNGVLLEKTSDGTEADYWKLSKTAGGAFNHFYESGGETDKYLNGLTVCRGKIAMLCFNDSGAADAASNKTSGIGFDADNAAISTALNGLTTLDESANITVAGGPASTTDVTVEFRNALGSQSVVKLVPETDASDPLIGQDEKQRITITGTPTGGDFTLSITVGSTTQTTAAIAHNAAHGAVQSALQALSLIDAVTTSGGSLPGTAVDVEFTGSGVSKRDQTLMTATSSLTGGSTPAITMSNVVAGFAPTITVSRSIFGWKFANEVQKITVQATAGKFKLAWDGATSVQLLDIDHGNQTRCEEVQEYGPRASADKNTTNNAQKIINDELGNLYTLTRFDDGTVRHVLTKFNTSMVQQWQQKFDGTHRSLAYDFKNSRIAVVGGNVLGTNDNFGIMAVADGSTVSTSDLQSVSIINDVAADIDGGFRLYQNGTSKTVFKIGNGLSNTWIVDHGAGDRQSSSNAAVYVLNPENTTSKRQSRAIAVAGGIVYGFDDQSWITVTSGGTYDAPALELGEDIFSVQHSGRLFFADGVNAKYYDGADNEVKAWTTTDGTLPIDGKSRRPTLIENWRGRIVMSGTAGDPQEWYMSKLGDPFDWNYSPATTSETQATAGANAPAGKAPDAIRTIIPVNDDILVFGCDHTIWQMTGDPMMGGRLDLLAEGVGTPHGRPWCQDGARNYYLMSTDGTVYMGSPQGGIQKISDGRIEERLQAINLDSTLIRMIWNSQQHGVHLFLTPRDSTSKGEHYFYDPRGTSWWMDVFDAVDASGNYYMNPRAVHNYDGDDPDDRAILMGGYDGHLRKWTLTASDDDGSAINSYVYLGPLKGGVHRSIRLKEMRATLGLTSASVAYNVFAGDSSESAYDSTVAAATGTFSGTMAGKPTVSHKGASGQAIFVKLSNSTVAEKWTLEKLECSYQSTDRKFARIS